MSTMIAATWIERFAHQLIERQPETRPLEAVRSAMNAHDSTWHLLPEEAADAYVATSSKPSSRAHGSQRASEAAGLRRRCW